MFNWIKNYITSPTHQWWVDNVWRPSWTKLTSWVLGLPAAMLAGLQVVASWAKDDTVSQYLTQMNVPNYVPAGLATVALLYYIAHGRSSD